VACFKALLSPINGDKERAIKKSASEDVCAVSATLRVVSRFERNTEYKTLFGIAFHQILNFFFAKIECGLYFLDRLDLLMSKIIFKK